MGAGCQQGPWLMWALFFPPQEGECLEAQRRLVALLMAFVCSLPRDVSWGGRRVLPEHHPAQLHSKLCGQRKGQAVAPSYDTLCVPLRW